MDALTISRYVVNQSIDNGKPVSNLKLQKLLYYIQANSLIKLNKKCFEEDIVSWKYGPVVEAAYQEFKLYGRKEITEKVESVTTLEYNAEDKELVFVESEFDESAIKCDEKKVIEEVLQAYENVSANQLVTKTHKEGPWRRSKIDEIIEIENIVRYYKIYKEKILQL